MSHPHRASRLERRVHGVVEHQLDSRGWTPRVVPFTGYGSTGASTGAAGDGWVRVLARVLLAPPGTPRAARTDGRGWRRFVSASAAGVAVTIEVAGRSHTVTSGPDGYVDVRLDADLEPGWTTVALRVADADAVHAPVRVVGPATTLGLLSDLDDTVIVTMLPRPLLAFRNAFLVREDERRVVPGMAELYAEVLAGSADVFVVYLSTGAWNTARPMTSFLDRHGYPAGPLLMTDWGPTSDGWFRSGQAHKRSTLRRLFEELPQLRWLLVGDDGQHDPTLYAEAVADHPDRVVGVAIRELSLTEQLAAVTSPAPGPEGRDPSAAITVRAPDGHALARGLRERGILPRSP